MLLLMDLLPLNKDFLVDKLVKVMVHLILVLEEEVLDMQADQIQHL